MRTFGGRIQSVFRTSYEKLGGERVSPLLALLVLSTTASGCGIHGLQELEFLRIADPDPADVRISFCTIPADQVKTRTKYIFVMDKSGSNLENYQLNPDGSISLPLNITPALATDPDGTRRYDPLISFLSNAPDDPDRYYSLINFSRAPARVVRGFTNDRLSFLETIRNERANLSDQGATHYLSALEAAYNLIEGDIQNASRRPEKIASSYIIVFISDGFPILSIDASTSPPRVNAQSSADILKAVRNIVSLQANIDYVDSINLFTGYYYLNGNEDPNARQLLKDMAEKTGNGVAYEFGTGSVIDFSVFAVPERLLKYKLEEVIVANANAAWWNGEYLLDTDADGLPDEVEIQLGSDPVKRDSDGNGVSDYVEYRLSPDGKPCKSIINGKCDPAGRTNFRDPNQSPNNTACTVSPISIGGGNIDFADSDGDGLNDCEEMVLGNVGGITQFDSNRDLLPDGLAFLNGLPFQSGTTQSSDDSDFDGMSDFLEIKGALPPLYPNFRILNLKPMRYDMRQTSQNSLQDCYNLNIHGLQLTAPDNLIRVYVMQSTSAVVHRPILKTAEKRMTPSTRTLEIKREGVETSGVWR